MTNLIKYELPSVRIKSGESAAITTPPVSPRGRVCPVGLEIDPDVAPHLMVTDIKVGKNSQLISGSCLPASLFAISPPVEPCFDRIPSYMSLTINLTCIAPHESTFKGRLLAVLSDAPVPGKLWALGFGYTEVGAGEAVEVTTHPQVGLRLKRLHVPSHLLDVIRVDALFQGRYLDVPQASRVADVKQLGKENLLRGGEITLDPTGDVGIGQPVTVLVTNTSKTTQYFSAALIGEYI